ncbi:hypothetical protein M3650_15220 [Paenibacillus sp. MER TA 81-3]|uniref:hypothetical protein n=1 Tax=Paenibacillus sp. MER TA 81-3 TaxID=2939573 RepID=UPI00203F922A|nr:hypothetical protein [Paenibacillus sp. MER TA 81-3]MCM3339945.1 hypothetical protein [Paenibacillus sp. MER TA 81-3]
MSITNSTDVDWYKWTNTAGQNKLINLLLYKTGEGNYDLGIMIRYQDGEETTKLYAAEDGKVRYIPNLYIPAGAFFVLLERMITMR